MKIRELLDKPEKWTQGCTARDKDGIHVMLTSAAAVCWCLMGAVWKCYLPNECGQIFTVLGKHVGDNVGFWNDARERTFEDVQKLIKELDL